MKKLGLILYRYSGAGNKFVLIDLRSDDQKIAFSKKYKLLSRKNLAKRLCKTYRSTGGDGLVFLENTPGEADLAWDFYNADGSSAEMCGNAARCVGLHCAKKGLKDFRLKTGSGIVHISVQNVNKISVTMNVIKNQKFDQSLKAKSGMIKYDFMNTGVPHTVINIKSWKLDHTTAILATFIKKQKIFQPKSTNVTYYRFVRAQTIRAATYERGVLGYTEACGTGAVAAAASFAKRHFIKSAIITVLMPGGRLQVDLRKSKPILIGPAKAFPKIHV